MSTIEAIILGIVQGITEFFPVSSSGHLKLGQYFLGLNDLDKYIIFDLVCHLGTLLAIVCLFFKDIKESFTSNKALLLKIVIATLPLFPLLLILKPIKSLFNAPQYLGFFFMATALLLYIGIRLGSSAKPETLQKYRWRDPLFIGIFQAAAILPGVSRSGSTISGARLLGWDPEAAVRFSFLLAIPAILGGICIEILQITLKPESHAIPSLSWIEYTAGFVTSFIVGTFALILLQKLAVKQKFMYFVGYCAILGVFTTVYFNFMR